MSEAPEDLHLKFQEAFNRHDLESLVALYEPGAVFVGGSGAVHGIEAIRETYRGVLDNHPIIKVETLGVNRAGELAMLHGKWTLRATGEAGVDVYREGRNTETVRLQPDGRWLFVIDNPRAP